MPNHLTAFRCERSVGKPKRVGSTHEGAGQVVDIQADSDTVDVIAELVLRTTSACLPRRYLPDMAGRRTQPTTPMAPRYEDTRAGKRFLFFSPPVGDEAGQRSLETITAIVNWTAALRKINDYLLAQSEFRKLGNRPGIATLRSKRRLSVM
jgi:hypothetical protein